jgi:hypothetical protein
MPISLYMIEILTNPLGQLYGRSSFYKIFYAVETSLSPVRASRGGQGVAAVDGLPGQPHPQGDVVLIQRLFFFVLYAIGLLWSV